MSEAKFPKGIMFKERNEKAPSYVLGNISIHRKDLITWLTSESEDWINLQIKRSQNEKVYIQVDTWKPEKKEVIKPAEYKPQTKVDTTPEPDDLPF